MQIGDQHDARSFQPRRKSVEEHRHALDAQRHEELRIWWQALRAYRSRNWELAEVNLHNLQRLAPGCMLYTMYAERVRHARATPMTADWEPVTVFDEK